MAKYQLQRLIAENGPTGKPEWRDICSARGIPGPADKATALASLAKMRQWQPGYTYRVVKLIKEQ